MADILKISTPLVEKSPVQPNRPAADPNIPFNLSDVTKVIQTNQQSELLKQNNGMIEQQEAPNILMNLMKDPSVTVGFLKNIFMLQEIIKLLPVNNSTFTQEIQQLFDALLLEPKDIVAELMRQENTSTSFKGEVFDFLRQLVDKNPQPEMQLGVSTLLKAMNAAVNKEAILNSLSNSLSFLAKSVNSSVNLSTRLMELAERFRSPDAAYDFKSLKEQTMAIFQDVESSILFSPKIQKLLPLITYNLSRFNDNPDFLQDATNNLMTLIDGEKPREKLLTLLYKYFSEDVSNPPENSHVIDTLAHIIARGAEPGDTGRRLEDPALAQERDGLSKPAENETMTLLSSEKVEKIVHSLLSSPCNFTPLLHFIIPVQENDLRSFAEIWIDPNDEDAKGGYASGDEAENVHMLIVFDIEGIGRFEAEFFIRQKQISMSLFCPPVYTSAFSQLGSAISRSTAGTGYRFDDILITDLERARSLMDVFKNLPHKRTGVDVKV